MRIQQPGKRPTGELFDLAILNWLDEAWARGEHHHDMVAGQFYRELGDYRDARGGHRIPMLCAAMKRVRRQVGGNVLPNKLKRDQGATYAIRYQNPAYR